MDKLLTAKQVTDTPHSKEFWDIDGNKLIWTQRDDNNVNVNIVYLYEIPAP